MSNVITTPATLETQIATVKALVQQQILTPEQGLARMAQLHADAAKGANGAAGKSGSGGAAGATTDEERKPPRVARTPMVLEGPSKDELLRMLAAGDITVEDFKAADAELHSKIDLAVSAKGWFSLYVKGMRFPITIPVEVAAALTSEAGAAFTRAFIATNSAHFDRK
jgi:hypothetical protein